MAKLIIAEGLPGTGKSTTASVIAERLPEKGKRVLCVDEGAPNHPADCDNYDFPDFETERRLILAKRKAWSWKSTFLSPIPWTADPGAPLRSSWKRS